MNPSPLFGLPGAVAADGADASVAAHYGSFNTEQRTLSSGDGFVDLSHRDVVRISGPDRLTWLHSLTTQFFEGLEPGRPVEALVLSPQGHVEHAFRGVDDGSSFVAHLDVGRGPALIAFLDSMRFMMRVEVVDVTADFAVCWRPVGLDTQPSEAHDQPIDGRYDVIERNQLEKYAAAVGPACGLWAFDALRIARGEPRIGVDTDHRTIPNEVGWVPSAVHLDKGCYRGQETVARVHTLGRPPRRLTLLHLDGSENRLPVPGSAARAGGRDVGFVGSSARHFELGPIALAIVKRGLSLDASIEVDGLVAHQEVVVDPEVGLHVRPQLGG
ncbi:MAG: CAF17-like 4Fe-4S cluster assembly/insertion protein YgfZ [Marmoricola sp.]